MLCNMLFEIKAGLLGDDTRLIRDIFQPAKFTLEGCACFLYEFDDTCRKREDGAVVFVQQARPLIADETMLQRRPPIGSKGRLRCRPYSDSLVF